MTSLTITQRQVRGVVVVDLVGKVLLGETNRQLHEAIRNLVEEGKKQVVLNLEKVTAIDSSGLGEIVAGFSTLRSADGQLKLANMPARVTDLMTITKLYTVFEVYDTEREAIDSFEEDEVTTTQPADETAVIDAKAANTLL
jgi:anti-sigma B factor antagonist